MLDTLCKPKDKGGEGWRAIVVNSRGCAQGPLTTPKLYQCVDCIQRPMSNQTDFLSSAGATYDLKNAMLYIGNMFPDAPIYGIGFSLGAAMLTKYLGKCTWQAMFPNSDTAFFDHRRYRSRPDSHEDWYRSWVPLGSYAVSSVITVHRFPRANQVDMYAEVILTCRLRFEAVSNWIAHCSLLRRKVTLYYLTVFYSRAMGGNLRTVLQRHLSVMAQNPKLDVDAIVANPNLTLYEFDTLITSKCAGFVRRFSQAFFSKLHTDVLLLVTMKVVIYRTVLQIAITEELHR